VHPHAELVTRFYQAFARRDAATMRAAYTPDATFSDAAFVDLRGAEVGDMWAMLCTRARDFRLEFRDVVADDVGGRAHWEARYLFQGKRPVHNVIEAAFTFQAGRIATHVDTFDFWRWSRQALGLPGVLLGWSGGLQRSVQQRSRKLLDDYRRASGS
jgi:ketosteroid isomerase-like protein